MFVKTFHILIECQLMLQSISQTGYITTTLDLFTCTKPDTMVLVRPPEAAANAITRAIRPTAACDIFPATQKVLHHHH